MVDVSGTQSGCHPFAESSEKPKLVIGSYIVFIKSGDFGRDNWGMELDEYREMLGYENKVAEVISEGPIGYYTIRFKDNYMIEAVSEYHLKRTGSNEELKELYESGNSRGFNKAMASRVPVKDGCVDLGDICDALDEARL